MDAVLLTLPNVDILDVNPAAEKLFGYSLEEMCNLGRYNLVDVYDYRLSEFLLERELTGKCKGKLTLIKKDGSKFTAEISSKIVMEMKGHHSN